MLTQATVEYFEGQQRAGIDAFQLFDSWAGVLSPADFERFCLPSYKKIFEKAKVPTVLFSKGTSQHLSSLIPLANALSLDSHVSLKEVRIRAPHLSLQGNLDPDALYLPLKRLESEVKRLLDDMRGDKGFIFNLSHGVKKDVPFEAVKAVVDQVKGYS